MFRWGPKIVTDGLFTLWDAGNPNCYPGEGTTMYDLIGDTDVTLETSGICSHNPGVMTFTANTGDTGVVTFSQIDVTTGMSMSVWVNSTGDYQANYGARGVILSKNSAYSQGLWFYNNNETSYDNPYRIEGETLTNGEYFIIQTHGTQKRDVWYNVGITFSSSDSAITYMNGEYSQTRGVTNKTPLTRIGGNNSGALNIRQAFEGKIGPIMFYNRELSAVEWKQNYEAMRGRFEDNDLFYHFDASNILSYKTPTQESIHKYSDWDAGSGSTTNWSILGLTSTNTRWVTDSTPWGVDSMVWDGKDRPASDADAGPTAANASIDNTQTYRYSIWVDQYERYGNFYFGLYGSPPVVTLSTGLANTNPYFYWTSNPATYAQLSGWTLVVGHVHPWDYSATTLHADSGRYLADGRNIGDVHSNYKWSGTTTQARLRSYLFYSTDPASRQRWIFPRVDLCDGTEPSIQDLINNNPDRVYDLVDNEPNNIGHMISGCEFSNSGQGSIFLDGIKSCIITEKDSLLNDYGTITGTFLTSSSAGDMVIFANYPINFDVADIGIDVGHFAWDKTGSAGYKETVETFNDGEWHHFALVMSDDKIYIDGIEQELQAGTMYRSTQKTIIGARYNGSEYSQFFDGYIGSIKIFRKALEDYEVLAEYDKIKTRFE